jgi:hypothetical protein
LSRVTPDRKASSTIRSTITPATGNGRS